MTTAEINSNLNLTDAKKAELKEVTRNARSDVRYMIESVIARGYVPTYPQCCNAMQLRPDSEEADGLYFSARQRTQGVLGRCGLEISDETVEVRTGFFPGQATEVSHANKVRLKKEAA